MAIALHQSFALATCIAAASLTAIPQPAHADTIYGDRADNGILHNPNTIPQTQLGSSSNNAQEVGINSFEKNMVLLFKLPDRPAGQQVDSAHLAVSIAYSTNSSPIDLYGLPWQANNAIDLNEYYTGPGDPNADLIQQTFLTNSTPTSNQRTGTSPAADDALVDYLNAQYDNGAAAGDFVLFRLNRHDTTVGPYSVIAVNTADFAPYLANSQARNFDPSQYDYYYNYFLNQYTPLMSPELDLTFAAAVPEPASLSLLGLGALAMLRRRRRA